MYVHRVKYFISAAIWCVPQFLAQDLYVYDLLPVKYSRSDSTWEFSDPCGAWGHYPEHGLSERLSEGRKWLFSGCLPFCPPFLGHSFSSLLQCLWRGGADLVGMVMLLNARAADGVMSQLTSHVKGFKIMHTMPIEASIPDVGTPCLL